MMAPIIINNAREPNPIRCEEKISVAVATNNGARNAVTVADKANSPKTCVARSGGAIFATWALSMLLHPV